MRASRDRSVVRSSVIPSAKYCWSGSLLRLANGSTTIDRRGATRGCEIDVAAAIDGAVEGFVAGQSHQPMMRAMTSTAAAPPSIVARVVPQRRGFMAGVLDADRSATASGR